MDIKEMFDVIQNNINDRLQENIPDETLKNIFNKDDVQAQVQQVYGNNKLNGVDLETIEKKIDYLTEVLLKIINNSSNNNDNQNNIPNQNILDGERGLNTMERKVLNFTDFVNESKSDMKGKKCKKCKKGIYKETSMMDDMKGVLHCDACGHMTERYV